ncbi:MAG: protein kinase [Bdellovibrionales bacterium]|nr:protein kinase [Bdellovibrionales bacterium]
MLYHFASSVHTYEVQEILGESHTSLVYLAQRLDKDLKIRQALIIKQFKQKQSPLLTLQLESLLRARHSPHLVKALFFEKFRSYPALILEYICSVNLKQLMTQTKLSQNEIRGLCAQVLTGLEELKKNDLAHGDLSPSNILIDTKGQVYLTDYGLANYQNGACYGTKPFIAPEIYKGRRGCFQSDLFSLGVLEKVLKGRFTEEELASMESKHFICKEDPLLDPHPQKRNIPHRYGNGELRALPLPQKKLTETTKSKPDQNNKAFSPLSYSSCASLGNKVQQILFIKNHFSQKALPPSSFIPHRRNYTLQNFFSQGRKKERTNGKRRPPFREQLGNQVNRYFFSRIKKYALPCYHPFLIGVLFFLFLFTTNPFISYGKYIPPKEPAKVLIRTQKWVYIQLAGFEGYTPITFFLKKEGTYQLKWKKQNKNGLKYIYLKPGQEVFLTDQDFL